MWGGSSSFQVSGCDQRVERAEGWGNLVPDGAAYDEGAGCTPCAAVATSTAAAAVASVVPQALRGQGQR